MLYCKQNAAEMQYHVATVKASDFDNIFNSDILWIDKPDNFRKHEQTFANKLKTLHPFGLNNIKNACDLRDILLQKVSRTLHAFFLRKWFCMVISNFLSRGLGNIAKVYLISCGQSTCSKLKKHEFSRNFSMECP